MRTVEVALLTATLILSVGIMQTGVLTVARAHPSHPGIPFPWSGIWEATFQASTEDQTFLKNLGTFSINTPAFGHKEEVINGVPIILFGAGSATVNVNDFSTTPSEGCSLVSWDPLLFNVNVYLVLDMERDLASIYFEEPAPTPFLYGTIQCPDQEPQHGQLYPAFYATLGATHHFDDFSTPLATISVDIPGLKFSNVGFTNINPFYGPPGTYHIEVSGQGDCKDQEPAAKVSSAHGDARYQGNPVTSGQVVGTGVYETSLPSSVMLVVFRDLGLISMASLSNTWDSDSRAQITQLQCTLDTGMQIKGVITLGSVHFRHGDHLNGQIQVTGSNGRVSIATRGTEFVVRQLTDILQVWLVSGEADMLYDNQTLFTIPENQTATYTASTNSTTGPSPYDPATLDHFWESQPTPSSLPPQLLLAIPLLIALVRLAFPRLRRHRTA